MPTLNTRTTISTLLLGATLALWAGCDTVEPSEADQLVVEAFLEAGRPLPDVTLRRSRPLQEPYDEDAAAAVGAEVDLGFGGMSLAYLPAPGRPGAYEPALPSRPTVLPGTAFELVVRWNARHAVARGTIPPPIVLDSVQIDIPDQPVQAVLADTLGITGAEEGFIYPVEVTLWWTAPPGAPVADSLYWVQTLLRPVSSFSSAVVDFFLLPEEILQEASLPSDGARRRHWSGVYAVPVEQEDDPIPQHSLTVALLRSGADYARFAISRNDPERREPISNVTGAVGIVAGISVDSLRVQIGPGADVFRRP